MVAVLAALLATVAVAPSAGATHGFEIIRTVAGNGSNVTSGMDGPAVDAGVPAPFDVVVAPDGSFYIAGFGEEVVYRVDSAGIITIVAGGGTDTGDGIAATAARLPQPSGVALDGEGNLYISTQTGPGGFRIRMVDLDTGIITTVAGTGTPGIGPDGGLATETQIFNPQGLVFDDQGNLYFAEEQGDGVRRIDAATGIITTVAGGGTSTADGIPATDALIDFAVDVDLDNEGNLYIADRGGNLPGTIRRVDLATGIITTVAGGGTSTADGIPATQAQFNGPQSVVADDEGGFYISDGRGVFYVDAAGIITTVVPAGEESTGDGGPPAQGTVVSPHGIAFDENVGLLITELFGHRVRQVTNVPDLLEVFKTGTPESLNVGDGDITYTIEVASNGGPATGVVATDTLSPDVDFVSAEPSQGTCAENAGTLTCEIGDIASDTSATITVVVTPTAGGVITNTVTVDANEAEPFPANNSATAETRVGAADCGQVITTSTTLTADIGPCPGNGVIIGRDGLTLDLGGFRIFGFPGPSDGNAAGIRLPMRAGVTIQNGTVSDFDAGILLNGGRSNTLQNLDVLDNVGPDDQNATLGDGIVLFDSRGNLIINNVIAGNGIFDGIALLGDGSDFNRIVNNVIEDTVSPTGPTGFGGLGQGITINGVSEDGQLVGTITGTRITDNEIRNNGSGGIASTNGIQGRIERNLVERNGVTNFQGAGIAIRSFLFGGPLVTDMMVRGNVVRENGQDGILVGNDALGNLITNNDSIDNGGFLGGIFYFDLVDQNPDCDNNTWRGNDWGSGGYNPPCTTIGGTGPNPPAGLTATAAPAVSATAAADAPAEETPIIRQAPAEEG